MKVSDLTVLYYDVCCIVSVIHEGVGPYSLVLENKYSNAVYNWLAPELLSGQSPTVYSDIYSLTAVLWELLNGRPITINYNSGVHRSPYFI